ncbi:cytochrome b [Enterovibrio norvegicus]|uniref:Cytochrome B n=1 Tax=Enterovibrio norvegicus TaxID=188144 RepID=A0A2N7LGA7_9GAMM|nr:cytochrome b/b6 domain-containing protein [Enterovibrio norvegicus]PMN94588.1 cytochrome B [Enterovibrio norvegicus]
MIQKRYDALSRVLHWSMALIIIYATIAGYVMHLVIDSHPAIFDVLSVINMSLSTIAAGLFVVRWVWRSFRPKVKTMASGTVLDRNIAKFVHGILYSLMFFVFVTGFLMLKEPFWFFWLFKIPNIVSEPAINAYFFTLHRVSCALLAFTVVVHIAAALYHQYWMRDNIIERLLPPKGVALTFKHKKGRI